MAGAEKITVKISTTNATSTFESILSGPNELRALIHRLNDILYKMEPPPIGVAYDPAKTGAEHIDDYMRLLSWDAPKTYRFLDVGANTLKGWRTGKQENTEKALLALVRLAGELEAQAGPKDD